MKALSLIWFVFAVSLWVFAILFLSPSPVTLFVLWFTQTFVLVFTFIMFIGLITMWWRMR